VLEHIVYLYFLSARIQKHIIPLLFSYVSGTVPSKFQALKYGAREDYKEYVKNTPMLIPFGAGDDVDELVKAAKVINEPALTTVFA
jgi:hypothetical protein